MSASLTASALNTTSPFLDFGLLDYNSLDVGSPSLAAGVFCQTHVLNRGSLTTSIPTIAEAVLLEQIAVWALGIWTGARPSFTTPELVEFIYPHQHILPPPVPPPHQPPPVSP